ncbi:MAG: electron transfer flavoprotein subunit alpha/FixB family protein [Capnocytophaga sp.]|nr:electron transfer flavoprotein subunit alpha/FixB family protein [Capnocytophaga sp.]
MSVLIYAESENGTLKKSAFEVASYAVALAEKLGTTAVAVTINAKNTSELGTYGISKIVTINDEKLSQYTAKAYAKVLEQTVEKEHAGIIVLSSSANAKYLAPLLAVNLNAGLASNVASLPESADNFTVKCHAFSNKAYAQTKIKTDKKLICLTGNAFGIKENRVSPTEEAFTPTLTDADFDLQITGVDKASGKVSIADAAIVVSGGRGLKAPENWGMIEELADVLGAATACSKPVADMDWRPHSEHVGQTGKPVAANLYIAIGISGAIQHLAGVDASRVKVVINNDENAPFFKAADYGVLGDAFEVVPKLTEKLKAFKGK